MFRLVLSLYTKYRSYFAPCACLLGWLEKREVPKTNFSHADPGVYVFGGLKKVV